MPSDYTIIFFSASLSICNANTVPEQYTVTVSIDVCKYIERELPFPLEFQFIDLLVLKQAFKVLLKSATQKIFSV